MERSGPKIGWSGAERVAGVTENDGAGAERGAGTERGAGAAQLAGVTEIGLTLSSERFFSPLTFRSHALPPSDRKCRRVVYIL